MSNNVSANSQAAQSVGAAFNVSGVIAQLQNAALSNATHILQGHLRTYQHVADTLEFYLKVANDPVLYSQFVSERERLGVPGKTPDGNEFLPWVRLLNGHYVQNGKPAPAGVVTSLWVPDRSSEKIAKVLRNLKERGIDPKEVVKFISGYKDSEGRTKLLGLMAADSLAHPSAPRASTVTWKSGEQDIARKAKALCDVDLDPSKFGFHDGFTVALLYSDGKSIEAKQIKNFSAADVIRFIRANLVTPQPSSGGSKGYQTGNGVSVDPAANDTALNA